MGQSIYRGLSLYTDYKDPKQWWGDNTAIHFLTMAHTCMYICTCVHIYICICTYKTVQKKLSKMGRLISVFENSIFHDDDIIRAVPSAVPSPAPMSLIRGPWSELAAWQQFVNLSKVGRYISTVNWVLLCIRSMHTVYVYRYIEWYWQIIQISSDLLYIYT